MLSLIVEYLLLVYFIVMSDIEDFEPFPFLDGYHRQTIFGNLLNFHREPPSKTENITLEDGDTMTIQVSTPENWNESMPSVVMIHGLCGSHRSVYLIRMTRKLLARGVRAIRLNLKGCGSSKGLSKGLYHSGSSPDIFEVLTILKKRTPHSVFSLIGFSLSGNIVLKLAGEQKERLQGLVSHVIAVSPPVDLYNSLRLFDDQWFYNYYFLRLLKGEIAFRQKRFKEELEHFDFPKPTSFYSLDETYISKHCGFQSALDYYEKCSSKPLIKDIAVPCDILLAEDDPLVDAHVLDTEPLPENVRVKITKKGGHMGYLGKPRKGKGFYWLDTMLFKWLEERKSIPCKDAIKIAKSVSNEEVKTTTPDSQAFETERFPEGGIESLDSIAAKNTLSTNQDESSQQAS